MAEPNLRLAYAFTDSSPSYVHGFEAGMLCMQMQAGPDEIKSPLALHAANMETFRRMAAFYGYAMETEPTEFDEWVFVTFTKGKPRPKLTVVK